MTDNTTTSPEENKLVAERRSKLNAIREKGSAFPNDFRRNQLAASLQHELGDETKDTLEQLDKKVAIAGRIMYRINLWTGTQ